MSSESESDGDYVPKKEDSLSEEGSADEETDLAYEKERLAKREKLKRKGGKPNGRTKKSRTTTRSTKPSDDEEEREESAPKDPTVEKKREEDLWASFLSDSSAGKPKLTPAKETSDSIDKRCIEDKGESATSKEIPIEVKDKLEDRDKRIFEFAGEKVIVDKTNKIVNDNGDAVLKEPPKFNRAKPGGGLSSLLNQIGKKNKLSTLEKTKLDWESFKSKEGIKEELNSHNKGKSGYLERQDFLERADHRQFEIEKNLRATKRSNR